MLNVQYGAEGLLNPGRKASPELTKALKDAAQYPLDSPQYPPALQAATARAASESAVVFLFTQPTVFLATNKVSGLRPVHRRRAAGGGAAREMISTSVWRRWAHVRAGHRARGADQHPDRVRHDLRRDRQPGGAEAG